MEHLSNGAFGLCYRCTDDKGNEVAVKQFKILDMFTAIHQTDEEGQVSEATTRNMDKKNKMLLNQVEAEANRLAKVDSHYVVRLV